VSWALRPRILGASLAHTYQGSAAKATILSKDAGRGPAPSSERLHSGRKPGRSWGPRNYALCYDARTPIVPFLGGATEKAPAAVLERCKRAIRGGAVATARSIRFDNCFRGRAPASAKTLLNVDRRDDRGLADDGSWFVKTNQASPHSAAFQNPAIN